VNLCLLAFLTIWKASKRVREAHEREKLTKEREGQMREGDDLLYDIV